MSSFLHVKTVFNIKWRSVCCTAFGILRSGVVTNRGDVLGPILPWKNASEVIFCTQCGGCSCRSGLRRKPSGRPPRSPELLLRDPGLKIESLAFHFHYYHLRRNRTPGFVFLKTGLLPQLRHFSSCCPSHILPLE